MRITVQGGATLSRITRVHGRRVMRARILGVADLIYAVRRKREPRCSGRMAAHVVEVMEAILVSSEKRGFLKITSSVERPRQITPADYRRLTARTA